MGRSFDQEDSGGFEKFRKKPKQYKKGKNNRSNHRQVLRDQFSSGNDVENSNDEYLKWEEENER